MSQILFAVEIPPIPPSSPGHDISPAWKTFLLELKSKNATWKDAKQPLSSMWIGSVDDALPFLAAACTLADKHKLKYTALLLNGETATLAIPK